MGALNEPEAMICQTRNYYGLPGGDYCYFVVRKFQDFCAYLHRDGVWRTQIGVGDQMTGVFATEQEAMAVLNLFVSVPIITIDLDL